MLLSCLSFITIIYYRHLKSLISRKPCLNINDFSRYVTKLHGKAKVKCIIHLGTESHWKKVGGKI